ncbi:MAG: plasmid stabilization protein [Caulobacter sp.]|nr:plasmid stabilization protein [Caulobacter sp.]
MIYAVELLPEAKADIRRLVLFLIEKSPAAAERAEQTIRNALSTLSASPQRGRPTGYPDTRALVIPFNKRAYVARYFIGAEMVIVLSVRHSNEASTG